MRGSMMIAVPAGGVVLLDADAQLALGDVLQVLIDRELDAGPGGRRPSRRG